MNTLTPALYVSWINMTAQTWGRFSVQLPHPCQPATWKMNKTAAKNQWSMKPTLIHWWLKTKPQLDTSNKELSDSRIQLWCSTHIWIYCLQLKVVITNQSISQRMLGSGSSALMHHSNFVCAMWKEWEFWPNDTTGNWTIHGGSGCLLFTESARYVSSAVKWCKLETIWSI